MKNMEDIGLEVHLFLAHMYIISSADVCQVLGALHINCNLILASDQIKWATGQYRAPFWPFGHCIISYHQPGVVQLMIVPRFLVPCP